MKNKTSGVTFIAQAMVAQFILLLFIVWGYGAVWAARALGADVEYSWSVVGAMVFAYLTCWTMIVGAQSAVVIMAQPRQSAANLRSMYDAVRESKRATSAAADTHRH